MRRMTFMFSIRKEIKKLNERIDRKIIKGESYDREAQRHKDLVLQLRKLESEASLARTLSLASFLF